MEKTEKLQKDRSSKNEKRKEKQGEEKQSENVDKGKSREKRI